MIIIDGHNLIGAVKHFSLNDPENKNKLLKFLDSYQKIAKTRLIVVFDKIYNYQYERNDYNNIEVRYPIAGDNADLVIKNLLDKYENHCRLVTNDNELKLKAKINKIESISCQDFINKIENIIRSNDNNIKTKILNSAEIEKWESVFNRS